MKHIEYGWLSNENETPGSKDRPRNLFRFRREQEAYVQWTSEAVTIEPTIEPSQQSIEP